jgi:hypothetical protein
LDANQVLDFYWKDAIDAMKRSVAKLQCKDILHSTFKPGTSAMEPNARDFDKANPGMIFQTFYLLDTGSSQLVALFYADASFSEAIMPHYPIYSRQLFSLLLLSFYFNSCCYCCYFPRLRLVQREVSEEGSCAVEFIAVLEKARAAREVGGAIRAPAPGAPAWWAASLMRARSPRTTRGRRLARRSGSWWGARAGRCRTTARGRRSRPPPLPPPPRHARRPPPRPVPDWPVGNDVTVRVQDI